MARLDPRGAPDYSHHDYAAESVRMYEQGKREGAEDRANGKEPNAYLYRVASPDYSHAKGYREGYCEIVDVGGRMNVATYDDYFVESPIVAQQQCGDELDRALAKHGPRYVLANARRLLARKHKKDANWVLAMNIYSLGSTYARWLCQRYGLDPDATTT